MNCLNRVTIQEYNDKELDTAQILKIESHLQGCDICRKIFEEAKNSKIELNEFLSQINGVGDSIKIPEFSYNGRRKKPIYFRVISSLPFKVAASIAVLIVLFFILRTNVSSPDLASEDADILLFELIGNTEPNKSWHNSQMVIVITNEEGEVIQSFLSNEN